MLRKIFALINFSLILVAFAAGCSPGSIDITELPTETQAPIVPTSLPATNTPGPPIQTEMSAYQEVEILEAHLRIEVPAGWQQLTPEWAWAPDGTQGMIQIGVNWANLEPPIEPEAVMLPNHAQILTSEPVDLGWAQGRHFTLEIYAPATEQGDDTQAQVVAVEEHILVKLEREGARKAYDFYASGQTSEQLTIVTPSLQHMVNTVTLK